MVNVFRINVFKTTPTKGVILIKKVNIGRKSIMFIEADNYVDPSEYTEDIYHFVKEITDLHSNYSIYLDLSHLYGIKAKNWMYKWIWKINGDILEDEEFVPISRVTDIDEEEYEAVRQYIYSKVSQMVNNNQHGVVC